MRKIDLPRDFLYDLYVIQKMSTNQIARELGINRQTVSNKLKSFNIPIRNSDYARKHKVKPKIVLHRIPEYRNKKKFEKAYSELKSIDLVAKHFNIDVKTAFAWKKRHGIETIKEFSWKGREQVNHNKPYTNKEWLENMYSKYSFEDLGKMLNCSPSTVQKWARRFGIRTRNASEQWELKAKYGTRVIKKLDFDLQLYKDTYVLSQVSKLPKNLKAFIISLYGECENPKCREKEVLDVHHIDEDHSNNSPENHAVLCPNCHARIHRLGIPFSSLVPNHVSWETLISSYQEAK